MRSDLSRACIRCSWRIAEGSTRCPRCGDLLVDPPAALEVLRSDKKLSTKLSRPVRDLFLHVPGAVFSVAAILGGLAMSLSTAFATFDEISGMIGLLLVLGLFAGTAATAIILGCVWGVWAVIVLSVSWLANRGRRPLLRVAPFAHEAGAGHPPPEGDWLESATAWFKRRRKRAFVMAAVGIACVEIGLELASPKPYFFHHSLADSAKVIGVALLGQAIALAILSVPMLGSLQWLLWSFDRVRHVIHLLREERNDRLASNANEHIPVFAAERAHAEGRVVPGDAKPSIAPLSGRDCLAFRLQGRVGTAMLDDASAVDLNVDAGEERTVVRARRVLLVLDDATQFVQELDAEQNARVQAVLARLKLPFDADLELGESLLVEGNRVSVHGNESHEPLTGNGYRETRRVRVLGDGDDLPVVIVRD